MTKLRILFRLVALVLGLAGGMAGCGQKGPLYLPGDPSQIQTELPAQLPEQSGDEDDDEGGAGP